MNENEKIEIIVKLRKLQEEARKLLAQADAKSGEQDYYDGKIAGLEEAIYAF